MIRLTLYAQSQPEIHLFNKSTILIGADSHLVDLLLTDSNIQPIHLKIIEQEGFLVIINLANDPFASINGHPFGKKLLNSQDVIVVHETKILFEYLDKETAEAAELNESKKEEQEAVLSPALALSSSLPEKKGGAFTFELPFEQEVTAFKGEEWHPDSLETYFDKPTLPKEELPVVAKETVPVVEERKKPSSLKDDYLRDLEDENQKGNSPFNPLTEPSHLYQAWKWILLFIFSILTIAGIIGTVIYFSVTDKTEDQEVKMAQGVADVAMALMHAQLMQTKPHNQNWSDIDFLKTNLQTLLPATSSYALQINAQGQFSCCPYSLRTYTSSDLSHFLLIAQPAPSLLNWLIPRAIIVVDSQTMELHTLKDVRILNRLLANPNPLEGVNGKEIFTLVKQGNIIRLATLAQEADRLDFAPPKNLAWIHPGAENFIYNAPRYYRLGQGIIQKATQLASSKSTSLAVATLKQEVETFSCLNHLILYSDQGKRSALLTRQGLMTFAPSDKFLFGYLLFNAQGKIHQVNLLKEDEEWKENMPLVILPKDNDLIALQPFSNLSGTKEEGSKSKSTDSVTVDYNHPLYIQLQAIVVARDNELRPLSTALMTLINQELQAPHGFFQMEFQNLSHSYLMVSAKYRQQLKEIIDILYYQYENMPIAEFMVFMKELRLDQLIQQENESLSLVDERCIQNLETMLAHIEKSKSLIELDNFIHMALIWLNFDDIKDAEELVKYQNLLRNQVLAQLEKSLLSEQKHFSLKYEDREVLQHILGQERLIKPEEYDFFLEEFDQLVAIQYPEESTGEEEVSSNK